MPKVFRVRRRRDESEEEYQARREVAKSGITDAEPDEATGDPSPIEKKPRSRAPAKSQPPKEDIAALVEMVNMPLRMFPSLQADAMTPEEELRIVDALDAYKHKNERARRLLNTMVTGSALGLLLAATLPWLLRMCWNHGIIPAPQGWEPISPLYDDADEQEAFNREMNQASPNGFGAPTYSGIE